MVEESGVRGRVVGKTGTVTSASNVLPLWKPHLRKLIRSWQLWPDRMHVGAHTFVNQSPIGSSLWGEMPCLSANEEVSLFGQVRTCGGTVLCSTLIKQENRGF
jgi:hypothetical protein